MHSDLSILPNGPILMPPIPSCNVRRTGNNSHPTGTSPSHATPEGLSGGWGSSPAARAAAGGRPRVTVREMRAERFSFSLSMSTRLFVMRVSIRPVWRSRKSAMACCSSIGGSGNNASPIALFGNPYRVTPVAAIWNWWLTALDCKDRKRNAPSSFRRLGRIIARW